MKPIGGYFELELPPPKSTFLHSDCMALNSGRHAFEFILRQIEGNIEKIYLPYYTCDVMLEPLKRLKIKHEFYHIDENLEVSKFPELKDNEYIVVNNYFGIKDAYVESIIPKYGDRLIVDNSQALFAEYSTKVKCFWSPRKFVGVPDGGFANVRNRKDIKLEKDISSDRSSHLLRRIDSGPGSGYTEFKTNSNLLSTEPLKRMSDLTWRILQSLDYEQIKDRRKKNFEYLHKHLGKENLHDIPDMKSFECPMVYPYRTKDLTLRQKLIDNNIFVPTYWPNVRHWVTRKDIEYDLTEQVLPLPIDQRHGLEEMEYLTSIIKDS